MPLSHSAGAAAKGPQSRSRIGTEAVAPQPTTPITTAAARSSRGTCTSAAGSPGAYRNALLQQPLSARHAASISAMPNPYRAQPVPSSVGGSSVSCASNATTRAPTQSTTASGAKAPPRRLVAWSQRIGPVGDLQLAIARSAVRGYPSPQEWPTCIGCRGASRTILGIRSGPWQYGMEDARLGKSLTLLLAMVVLAGCNPFGGGGAPSS